jgi:hypothetical protein
MTVRNTTMLRITVSIAVITLLITGCDLPPDPANQHPNANIVVYVKNQNGEFNFFLYETPSSIPNVHFYSRKPYQRDWYYWGDESLEQFVDFFSSFIPD